MADVDPLCCPPGSPAPWLPGQGRSDAPFRRRPGARTTVMTTGLLAIILIVVTTMGLGLMAGAMTAALLEGNTAATSTREMPHQRKPLSRALLRGLLIPSLVFLVVGIIFLTHGYNVKNAVWLSLGYGSLFVSSLFLGGLFYQANI